MTTAAGSARSEVPEVAFSHAIFAAMRKPPQIEFIDMPEILRGKYQYYTRADISKLRGTGYDRPMTPLVEAVRDYVQGYLEAA